MKIYHLQNKLFTFYQYTKLLVPMLYDIVASLCDLHRIPVRLQSIYKTSFRCELTHQAIISVD